MEDDAGVRKRKRDGCGEAPGEADVAGKDVLAEEGGEYAGIAEESVAEVMRWLELEISLAPASSPASAALYQETAFVTINGNEESCGPSFSDSASTVMASVDTRGAGATPPPAVPWPWPAASGESPAATAGVSPATEEDEEWVAQVLTGGAALEGQ